MNYRVIIPNMFTSANLVFGMCSIISTFNGNIFWGAVFILLALVADGLDGRIIQIPILALFGLVSFAVYGLLCYKNGNLRRVFGNKFDKMIGKFIKI